MFSGPDPALQSVLNGLLVAAGAICAAAALAVVAAIRADPARAARYARVAGIARGAPLLVGMACLGFLMDAIDLRSGHEADVLGRWPALVPRLAGLTAGAGFLAGLLAGARPVAAALAAGGPTLAFSALVAGVTGLFLLAGWRADPDAIREGLRLAPAGVRTFFAYVALFPLVTMVASGAAASLGRTVRALLGIPTGARAPDRVGPAAAEPAAPPQPAPHADGAPDAGTPARQAGVRLRVSRATWPAVLCVVFGGLILVPSACSLLAPRAALVGSNPAGGAALSAAPSAVTLSFSGELLPTSTARVRRTVTLDEKGEARATGGTPVAEAAGPSALGPDRRTLRVALPAGLPGGLYLVDWTTIRAGGGPERFGDLYFGVGMEVPRFIRDRGAPRESDRGERDRREALAGGVLLIVVGVVWRLYAKAAQG